MKNKNYLLNLLFLATFLIACAGCSKKTNIDNQKPETKTDIELDEKNELSDDEIANIQTYFSDVLSEKNVTYTVNDEIRLDDLKAEQDKIWEIWKNANASFSEKKLIDLGALANKNHDNWPLPQNLEANVVMPYYWGSKGVKPNDGYPLFIYLHGSGDKNSEWSAGISLANQFNDGPSAYFVPQIPSMRAYRWWHKSKQFAWEKLLRLSFITGDIDQNKVYFMGISEGGYGSQRLASFYADYLAGAGPMAGGEPLINAPVENCRNIAFSLRTGAEDYGFYRNQFTKTAKDRFDAFEAKYPGSFVHFIDIIPGMGHGIDYFPTTPWLRKYKRNPYPKFVSWENFPMDGRYRDKFYNLLVKERSNADDNTRSYYEMQINGNSVSLKVSEMTYTATEKDQRWGIGMKYDRTYVPANKGKVVIYFNDKLIDLNNEVSISVNGKLAFRGMLKLSRKNIVESCAAFFDPDRLYPASVEVDLSSLK
jgi:predicted esterase